MYLWAWHSSNPVQYFTPVYSPLHRSIPSFQSTEFIFPFTTELERDGTLPFLDTKLARREDSTLDATVFRKPTHIDRYLHFSFHHPASAKRAAVKSFFDRARNITLRKENLLEEEQLTTTFKRNGYPLPFICAISSSMHIYRNHRHHQRSQMRNHNSYDEASQDSGG